MIKILPLLLMEVMSKKLPLSPMEVMFKTLPMPLKLTMFKAVPSFSKRTVFHAIFPDIDEHKDPSPRFLKNINTASELDVIQREAYYSATFLRIGR